MTHALTRSPFAHRGALILFGTLLLPGVTAAQVSIEQALADAGAPWTPGRRVGR